MFAKRNWDRYLAVAFILSLVAADRLQAQQPNPRSNQQPKQEPARPSEQRVQRLTFEVAGVDSEDEAQLLMKAFLEANLKSTGTPKLYGKLNPLKTNSARIVVMGGSETDLTAVCSKVCAAMTAKDAKKDHSICLVLFAKLDAQAANEAVTALKKIERVDAAKSKAYPSAGEIHVGIALATVPQETANPAAAPPAADTAATQPKEKPSATARPLTVATILQALNEAGIFARTETAPTATSG